MTPLYWMSDSEAAIAAMQNATPYSRARIFFFFFFLSHVTPHAA